jgi:hypothetical protein
MSDQQSASREGRAGDKSPTLHSYGDGALLPYEAALDSFDAGVRAEALAALSEMAARGEVALPQPGDWVNLHCHTFFSYNPYGYSPSKFAWLARGAGLAAAGIVDFDVLDGLEEFLDAGRRLDLRVCVGMETRVYVPEFAEAVINSPGEPGISYHMGVGFPTSRLAGPLSQFLAGLRQTSERRNRELIARVNRHVAPVTLDYDRDVLPLTPAGNATERHICLAYARRAQSVFRSEEELATYWAEKLGATATELDLPDGLRLQALIRAKTMKSGGVGYVQPDKGSFPRMADTNRFLLDAGAIPTHTWLDGTSEGERRMEELLQVAMSTGVAAVNVIPDRNYTPARRSAPLPAGAPKRTAGARDEKLGNLYRVVELADKLDLIVVAGTEMNSPGQKLVDDFGSPELAPLLPVFLRSAHIVYAHSVLQRARGLGYTSTWAKTRFPDVRERLEFYRLVGSSLHPAAEGCLEEIGGDPLPRQILEQVHG